MARTLFHEMEDAARHANEDDDEGEEGSNGMKDLPNFLSYLSIDPDGGLDKVHTLWRPVVSCVLHVLVIPGCPGFLRLGPFRAPPHSLHSHMYQLGPEPRTMA